MKGMIFRKFLCFILVVIGSLWSQEGNVINSYSVWGHSKHTESQESLTYVYSKAPKGGMLRIGVLNNLKDKDFLKLLLNAETGFPLLNSKLMSRSVDEVGTLYPLIAEDIDVNLENNTITFLLHKEARWSDGSPITATFIHKNFLLWSKTPIGTHPIFKYVRNIQINNTYSITFYFDPNTITEDSILTLATLPILPKEWLIQQKCGTYQDVTVSGPYILSSKQTKEIKIFEKVKDFWAENLFVNRGRYNFEEIEFHYFHNLVSLFEALSKGEIDLISYSLLGEDDIVKQLEERYQKVSHLKFSKNRSGLPRGAEALVFNLCLKKYQNLYLRQALIKLFDFSSFNTLFYKQEMQRYKSFYENTLVHSVCAKKSKNSCMGIKDTSKSYVYEIREQYARVFDLLEKAGYLFVKGQWVDAKTNETLHIIIYCDQKKFYKTLEYWAASARSIGLSIYVKKISAEEGKSLKKSGQFDLITHQWKQGKIPSRYQNSLWAKDGEQNFMGLKNPIFDALTYKILNEKDLNKHFSLLRELDKRLKQENFVIFLYYDPYERIFYQNSIQGPPARAGIPSHYVSWWHENQGRVNEKQYI